MPLAIGQVVDERVLSGLKLNNCSLIVCCTAGVVDSNKNYSAERLNGEIASRQLCVENAKHLKSQYILSIDRDIVLTYPYDAYLRNSFPQTPIPIYSYETTSYVSAFSGHQTFLEDEMNLENSGYDWRPRRLNSELFFSQKNEFTDRGFLVNNQIDYIYFPKIYFNQNPQISLKLSIENIFENSEIIIYQVNR